jgi:hypothetical protein
MRFILVILTDIFLYCSFYTVPVEVLAFSEKVLVSIPTFESVAEIVFLKVCHNDHQIRRNRAMF